MGGYAKPPFGGPEQVLAYLGRYTHRVAIANSRLVSMTDGSATVFVIGGTTPPRFRWVASRWGYALCMRHYGTGPGYGPDRM